MQLRIRYKIAVRFLIDKVPPSADALRQDDAGNEAVCHAPKTDFVNEAENDDADRPADDTAVNGEAAVTEVQPFAHISVKGAVIGARADDANRQDTDEKVERPFRRDIAAFEKDRDDDGRQNDAAYDDDRVPINGKAENGDAGIVGRKQ